MKARWLLGLLLVQGLALPCCGITLRQFLSDNSIPAESFSRAELEAEVQGDALPDKRRVVLVYHMVRKGSFGGRFYVAAYEKADHKVVHSRLDMAADDVCASNIIGIAAIDGYTLITTDINPSAGCTLVLDAELRLREILYGFSPVKVAPDSIVIIEDMVHFAPVHPERLQFADLLTGKTRELYPPKGDVLRAKLARENKKEMPPPDTCARMNDPCDPQLFVEDIRSLATDGKGQFAFIAMQSASHATQADSPPETVASQAVFYLYKLDKGVWRYCERAADASEASSGSPLDWNAALAHCKPTLAVVPDLSTAGNNPFLSH